METGDKGVINRRERESVRVKMCECMGTCVSERKRERETRMRDCDEER